MQFLHNIGAKIGSTLSPKNVSFSLKKFGGSQKEDMKDESFGNEDKSTDENKEEETNVKQLKAVKPGAKALRSMTDGEYEQLFAAVLAKVSHAEEMSEGESDDFDSLLDERAVIEEDENRKESTDKEGEDNDDHYKEIEMTTESQRQNEETPFTSESNKFQCDLPSQQYKEKATETKVARPRDLIGSKRPKCKVNESHTVAAYGSRSHKSHQRKKSKQSAGLREIHQKKSKRDVLLSRSIEETGTWVQCSLPSCHKWRFLADIQDPTTLPEVWTCPMNKDESYNSCDTLEQAWDSTEEEASVFATYTEASLVWARLPGYPHWPGMVEVDPDYGTFFECRSGGKIATHYHIVFFDDKVSRAWIAGSNIKPFCGEEKVGDYKCSAHGIGYKKQIAAAKKSAMGALNLSLNERLKKYSFAARYNGKWGVDDSQESELPITQDESEEVIKKNKKYKKISKEIQVDNDCKNLKMEREEEPSKYSVGQSPNSPVHKKKRKNNPAGQSPNIPVHKKKRENSPAGQSPNNPVHKEKNPAVQSPISPVLGHTHKKNKHPNKQKYLKKSDFFKKGNQNQNKSRQFEDNIIIEETHLERDVNDLLGDCEAIIQDANNVLEEFINSQEGSADKQLKSRLSKKHSPNKDTQREIDVPRKKKKKKKVKDGEKKCRNGDIKKDDAKNSSMAVRKAAFLAPKAAAASNQDMSKEPSFDPDVFTMDFGDKEKEELPKHEVEKIKSIEHSEKAIKTEAKSTSFINPKTNKLMEKKKSLNSFTAPKGNPNTSADKGKGQTTSKAIPVNIDTDKGPHKQQEKPDSKTESGVTSDDDMFLDLDTDEIIPSSLPKQVIDVAADANDSDAMEFQEE